MRIFSQQQILFCRAPGGTSGFSLVESILAAALLSLAASAIFGTLVYSQEGVIASGRRERAVFVAEEGVEAVRNIADANFASLTAGTYGLIRSGGTWTLSGTSDATDMYTRTVTIAAPDLERRDVSVLVAFPRGLLRGSGSVMLTSRVSNWRATVPLPVCGSSPTHASRFTINTSGASLTSGNRTLTNIFLGNSDATCQIVIATMRLTWTNASRTIQSITIGTPTVWTGNATSGTVLNITDTALVSTTTPNSSYRFSAGMNGNTFTIQATFTDGSSFTTSSFVP